MNQPKRFDPKEIGERLRRAREEKKLTQQGLGDQVGVRVSMISQWERGEIPSSVQRFGSVCHALDRSTDEILGIAETQSYGLTWKIQLPDPWEPDRDALQAGIDLFRRIIDGAVPPDIDDNGREMLIKRVLYTAHIRLLRVERDEKREEKLKEQFKAKKVTLKHCFVANLEGLPSSRVIDSTIRAEAVARLAVDEWLRLLGDRRLARPKSIGITGGTVMARFVELLPFAHPLLSKIEWLSLLATKEYLRVALAGTSANHLIGRLLYRQPLATGFGLPFVNFDRRERRRGSAEDRWELNYARDILSRARNVDMAFVTVGTREIDYLRDQALPGLVSLATIFEEMSEEDRKNCVGDVLLRLLDKNGEEISEEQVKKDVRKLVYSIELDDLGQIARRGEVFVLCERAEKSDVVAALVNKGLVNALVIDNIIADKLLEALEKSCSAAPLIPAPLAP